MTEINTKKRKGRTIREWITSRKPDFNPKQHQVLVNDVNYDNEMLLDLPLGPLDKISITAKD